MDKRPVPPEKRKILEGLIRAIDLVIDATVVIGGFYAFFFTPDSVRGELAGYEWLVPVWAGLLFFGGLGAFIGRLSRYWVIEVPSLPAACIGVGIYFVILGNTAFSTVTAAVASAMILVALLSLLRRYVELHIFASEPEDSDFRTRLAAMIQRRTKNVPDRRS